MKNIIFLPLCILVLAVTSCPLSPPLSVTSPTYSYYTTAPVLTYASPEADGVSATLNGTSISLGSGSTLLIGAVTGLNTVTVTATISGAAPTTQTVQFFLNNLATTGASDNFDRADSAIVNAGAWSSEYDQTGTFTYIENNRLVFKRGGSGSVYAGLFGTYSFSDDTFIERIDLIDFSEPTANGLSLSMGLCDNNASPDDLIGSLERQSGQNFTLQLREKNIPSSPQIVMSVQSSSFVVDFATAKTFIFCRRQSSYYVLLVDSDNSILMLVKRENYTPVTASFNRRTVGGWIDSSGTVQNMIVADNYAFLTP